MTLFIAKFSSLPIFILSALVLFASSVQAADGSGLYIKIGDANVKKSLVALPIFANTGSPGSSSSSSTRVGKDLYDTVHNDLEASDYFTFISPSAFLEDQSRMALLPSSEQAGGFNYASWKQIGAEFLIRVGYHISGSDLTVDTYAYYIPLAKVVFSKTYKSDVGSARLVAHTYANELLKELTGQPGFFLSKIVVSRSVGTQEKEIFMLDWDGSNSKQISFHHSIAISPAWSFDGKMIAYSAFAMHTAEKTRNLDLFTYNVESQKRLLVSYRRGMNSGASFCPDNRHVLLTISNLGNPDIYKMSLDGKDLTPLTHGRAGEINVEPAMSSDGKKIAYSSSRAGQMMIYTANSDGSGAQRRTMVGEYNSTPSWSPDGKKIAFAGQENDHFDIFVMDESGSNMVRLTSAKKASGKWANNEDPSFAPDGRHILFRSDRTGKYQLYVVSIDGTGERRITFDQNQYYKPRWSPNIN